LEGRLKVAVLEQGSIRVRAVGLIGGGGVGKTCALKAVGRDPDVARYFTGGVYYMSLGQDAKLVVAVREVASIVKAAGVLKSEAKILPSTTLSQATKEAPSWFDGQRCLFICDDLWATKSSKTGFFKDICFLISAQQLNAAEQQAVFCFRHRSAALKTSCHRLAENPSLRVNLVGRNPSRFCAATRNWTASRKCGSDRTSLEAYQYMLDQCAGLPFALAVAGGAMRSL
jgi:NB-ARC domain